MPLICFVLHLHGRVQTEKKNNPIASCVSFGTHVSGDVKHSGAAERWDLTRICSLTRALARPPLPRWSLRSLLEWAFLFLRVFGLPCAGGVRGEPGNEHKEEGRLYSFSKMLSK